MIKLTKGEPAMKASRWILIVALPATFALGCAQHYVTPGAGVSMESLTKADGDIAERMKREPAAVFPAHIAIVRLQAPEYRSYRTDSYGDGRYSVLTARDIERDEDWQTLENLPRVAGVATLNRLIIPRHLDSVNDLRLAAASLKADMLLVYSLDTVFRIDEHDVGPLRLISLGMLPTKEAKVTATASGALFDVRTGYIYGLVESTSQENTIASSWNSCDAVDESRQKAERRAFQSMVADFGNTWQKVLTQYDISLRASAE